jgi:dienelactone hydrolase/predicted ester cyclase
MATNDVTKKRVVYEMPGTARVVVRPDVEFRAADGGVLQMDLYHPADMPAGTRVPVVIIVAGYPDPGFEKRFGCRFKEMGSSVSWGRLIAASGMAAITYANREPVADLHALLDHVRREGDTLGIDGSRIGVWASSGNAPLAMSLLTGEARATVACAALCYGYLLDLDGRSSVADAARTFGFVNPAAGKSVDDLPDHLPLFIARAGRDELPGLNDTIDRFVANALARNRPLAVVNHATAPHAFDLFDDSEATRSVIRQVLAFLRYHLLELAGPAERPVFRQLSVLLLRELDALSREVGLYPSDEAVWAARPGMPNVGGTLVLHLVGNLRYFVGGVLGGTGYMRDREAEFSTRDVPRTELQALIADTRREVADTFDGLRSSDISGPFPVAVNGMTFSTELFMEHLLSHLAYHLGQIDYHRRALTGQSHSANALPLASLVNERS